MRHRRIRNRQPRPLTIRTRRHIRAMAILASRKEI